METTPVRQLLRTFCINSPWSYVVFWKLQQQSSMIFTFDDGYFDYLKLRENCSSMLDDSYHGQEDVMSFVLGTNFLSRESNSNPFGFELDMSWCQYKLGEGLVGGVALSGNDLWIHSDDIGSIEFPDEWLLPMKAGIKTTLLVPILPHGVLQLRSLEKVPISPAMVADIKGRFVALYSMICATSCMSNANCLLFTSAPLQELERYDTSLSSTSLHKRVECKYPEEICSAEITNQVIVSPTIGECLEPDDVDDVPFLYLDLDIQPYTENQFVNADVMNTTEDIWAFDLQEEGYFDGVPDGSFNMIQYYLTPEETQLVPELENSNETGFINAGDFIGFLREQELQEVVGESMQTESDRHSWSSEEENTCGVGSFVPLETERSGWFGEQDDEGHLLGALVTSLCNNSDEKISYWCNSNRSSVTSFAEIAPSFQVQTSNEVMDDMESAVTTLSVHPSAFGIQLTSPSSFERIVSEDTEEEKPMNYSCGLPIEIAKIPAVRGKSRQKIFQRPRPRDRQLIQDRLKKLRDLVPDGEKCSIDGLLDQAIKHMMFLKNVTQQAEKVKQFSDKELTKTENIENSRSNPSDTSWATEGEANSRSCPIIVKDLERPGDILIKILCNNEEIFFEMAQVMHQLKLTILKGVMETDTEKWAHFIVQVGYLLATNANITTKWKLESESVVSKHLIQSEECFQISRKHQKAVPTPTICF